MTTAILSFRTPGQVRLRCTRPAIDETRPLGDPPFAAWARAYADAHHRPDEEIRLLDLGRAIGAWLDGSERWLARLVEAAPVPLILEIETSAPGRQGALEAPDAPEAIDDAARDAPWELIAQPATGHLALDDRIRLSPVRRLDVPGEPRRPSPCRLSVLFMAAQPHGVTALDFEREEAAIAAEIGKLGPDELDLFVEESGTLDGLVAAARRAADCAIDGGDDRAGPVDVIHLGCHGLGGDNARLLLEDDVGKPAPATAGDLARELAAHVPALGFVSACSTAEASAAGCSFAAELCARGWPAVLGWSSPVADGDATWFAAQLYHRVAQRLSFADALAWCRCAAVASEPPRHVWHQARLFLGGAGGGPMAVGRGARRPRRAGQRDYLDRVDRVPVARGDEFVGRRRALQNVLGALRTSGLVGAVIHGAGQLGKSSLAARVSHRRPDLQTVVVYRDYEASAILAEVARGRPDADPILARHRPPGAWDAATLGRVLRELLEGPYRTPGDGAILLAIDDFEQVLEPPQAPETHARVQIRIAPTMASLIDAFAGARSESRLLFTSRYRFVLPDDRNLDLTRHLWHEPLGAMPEDDLAKQVRAHVGRGQGPAGGSAVERAARQATALALCHGNPGLLQLLLTIVDRAPATWPAVERELRAYTVTGAPVTETETAAFLARVALAELIGALAPDERELLRLFTSFETHVPVPVAAGLGSLVGIAGPARAAAAVERLISLGLVDLTLAVSDRPGRATTAHADEREIAVDRLAVPPLIAATQPLGDGAQATVARYALRPLRTAWDAAVQVRSLRECGELTRLAQLAADPMTLAEVAGRLALAVATTDPRQAAALAVAIEASDALWPNADELRRMADACQITGHPEIAERLLHRGLALEDVAPVARARLQGALAGWHRRRGELPAAEALFHTVRDAFERLGDVREVAVTMGQIADILETRGQLDEALRIRREEELPVYERLGAARRG